MHHRILICFTFFLTPLIAFSQSKNLEGIVANAEGLPMAGVEISIKGTKTSVISGECGQFEMSINTDKATLQFRNSAGASRFEIRLDSRDIVDREKVMFVMESHENIKTKCKPITDKNIKMYVVN